MSGDCAATLSWIACQAEHGMGIWKDGDNEMLHSILSDIAINAQLALDDLGHRPNTVEGVTQP